MLSVYRVCAVDEETLVVSSFNLDFSSVSKSTSSKSVDSSDGSLWN